MGGHRLSCPLRFAPEGADLILLERLRQPAPRVAGEDLEAVRSVRLGAGERLRDAAGDAFVSSEQHEGADLYNSRRTTRHAWSRQSPPWGNRRWNRRLGWWPNGR